MGFEPSNGNLLPKRNRKPEKVADLEHAEWSRGMLYQVWGLQEPGPLDPPKVRIRRGRVT